MSCCGEKFFLDLGPMELPMPTQQAGTVKFSIEVPSQLYDAFVAAACSMKRFDPKNGTSEAKERVAAGVLLELTTNYVKSYVRVVNDREFDKMVQDHISSGALKVTK